MKLINCLIVVAVLLVGLVVWGAYESERSWEAYSAKNHCRFVKQDTVYMPVMVGKTLMEQPYVLRTYVCDGGVEITR